MEAIWLDTKAPVSAETLAAHGVLYRHIAAHEEVYAPVIAELQSERGYIQKDVVELQPNTANLDTILQKFDGEHLHDEDEVRYVLNGEGIFDIRSDDDRWMRVSVSVGDLIVVPKGRWHRFELTETQTIRCVRLFQDMAGWVPSYRNHAHLP